jgi:hypothetical protein
MSLNYFEIQIDECKRYDNKYESYVEISGFSRSRFFFNKWYFDYIYNYYLGYTILKYSYDCFYKLLDKGLIEILLSQSLSKTCYKISVYLIYSQLGVLHNLSCFLFLGLIFLNLVIFIF